MLKTLCWKVFDLSKSMKYSSSASAIILDVCNGSYGFRFIGDELLFVWWPPVKVHTKSVLELISLRTDPLPQS